MTNTQENKKCVPGESCEDCRQPYEPCACECHQQNQEPSRIGGSEFHLFEKQESEWEKEFDRRFSPEWWHGFGQDDNMNKHGIGGLKAFIAKLLSKQKDSLENKYENCPQCTGLREEYRKSLVEKVEKIRQEVIAMEDIKAPAELWDKLDELFDLLKRD